MTIPKIVHQFWTGEPCPWDLTSWDLDGWVHELWTLDHLPDWFEPTPQWRDPDTYTFPFNHHRERMMSNVLRFELLGEFGGVWVDCDMELVGNPEDLLAGSCTVALMHDGRVGTSFIAAEPHHPFIESCRDALRLLPPQLTAVPGMWVANNAPLDGVTLLDTALVYPGPYWADDPPGVEPSLLFNRPRVQ